MALGPARPAGNTTCCVGRTATIRRFLRDANGTAGARCLVHSVWGGSNQIPATALHVIFVVCVDVCGYHQALTQADSSLLKKRVHSAGFRNKTGQTLMPRGLFRVVVVVQGDAGVLERLELPRRSEKKKKIKGGVRGQIGIYIPRVVGASTEQKRPYSVFPVWPVWRGPSSERYRCRLRWVLATVRSNISHRSAGGQRGEDKYVTYHHERTNKQTNKPHPPRRTAALHEFELQAGNVGLLTGNDGLACRNLVH